MELGDLRSVGAVPAASLTLRAVLESAALGPLEGVPRSWWAAVLYRLRAGRCVSDLRTIGWWSR